MWFLEGEGDVMVTSGTGAFSYPVEILVGGLHYPGNTGLISVAYFPGNACQVSFFLPASLEPPDPAKGKS